MFSWQGFYTLLILFLLYLYNEDSYIVNWLELGLPYSRDKRQIEIHFNVEKLDQCNIQFDHRLHRFKQLSSSFSKSVLLRFGFEKKVRFPPNFTSKLYWAMSNRNDYNFWKYVKIYFLQVIRVKATEDLNLSMAKIENCIKLTSSMLENQETPQKFIIIRKLSWPSKVWKAFLFWYVHENKYIRSHRSR